MTYKENITAILECYFTGFKKEIIDSACDRILKQESFMNKPCVAHQVCHEDKIKVLDKIKTEINAMPTDYCGGYIGLDKQEVLQVIDKYKAEGEE